METTRKKGNDNNNNKKMEKKTGEKKKKYFHMTDDVLKVWVRPNHLHVLFEMEDPPQQQGRYELKEGE
jgi:hypothetical protein